LCQYKVKTTTLDEVKNVAKASGEVKLTNEQQQVIVIEEGNWRINSVAGSGKTTVMSLRAIELFKKGYKPSDILLITFTNKGCGELKEKIAYWLKYCKIKSINKKSLNIFTFNGFGESIVSKQWKKLGFKQKPELATMVDVNDIIKELLQEYDKIEWLNYKNPLLNYPNAKGAFKQLTIYFDLIKSFNYNVNTLCDGVIVREKTSSGLTIANMMDKSTLIFEMYNKFNAKLKAKSLMQYQDQILYLIELLEKYPQLINTYGFKHVIVDEYQDTDFTQVKLMHLLTQYKGFKSLMVVGDSSQSVYGFRLTTPKNIIDFHKEFDNVKDIFLLDNFRSTPQICSTANKLDKLNTERIDKEIIGRKVDGKLPQLLEFNALEDEYKNITDLIEDKIKVGVPLHEICFIARTKKELLEIQDYLNKKNIPSIIEASERFLDNSNVQCIINLANFFKNNDYDYYLAEYLYIINNDFKTMDMNDIKKTVADFKISILEGFNLLEDETQKIEYFNTLISPILDIDTIAKDFMEYLNQTTFGAFNEMLVHLQKITLYEDDTSIEKSDSKYQAVCLTTGHSSKGKEWSIVINSIDNFKYETDDLQALEEERRLLFVSITRAKDELYVTYNTNQDKSRNKGKYCLFADELEDIEKIKI
jgi:superfamily I DNA/RNA helicase